MPIVSKGDHRILDIPVDGGKASFTWSPVFKGLGLRVNGTSTPHGGQDIRQHWLDISDWDTIRELHALLSEMVAKQWPKNGETHISTDDFSLIREKGSTDHQWAVTVRTYDLAAGYWHNGVEIRQNAKHSLTMEQALAHAKAYASALAWDGTVSHTVHKPRAVAND